MRKAAASSSRMSSGTRKAFSDRAMVASANPPRPSKKFVTAMSRVPTDRSTPDPTASTVPHTS